MQTQDVREAAQGAVDQSKSFLNKQVDERSTLIGQQIESVAQDLRNVGDQLRQSGSVGAAATYVDQGVDVIERLGRYLKEADGERLIADLETYARRQPWAIAAAALVLGFAASRFLKTSSTRRYREYGSYDRGGSDAMGGYGGGTGNDGATGYGEAGGYGASSYGETSYGRGGGERYAT